MLAQSPSAMEQGCGSRHAMSYNVFGRLTGSRLRRGTDASHSFVEGFVQDKVMCMPENASFSLQAVAGALSNLIERHAPADS